MINDVKSTHYISWTELGTSFVVSNVGEFSRSILGSHFKHNNVCSSYPFLLLIESRVRVRKHIQVSSFSHILFFLWISQLNLHPPTVLKLCAPVEHVWVPQDQQSQFFSLILYPISHQPYPSSDPTCAAHIDRRPDLGIFSPQIPSWSSRPPRRYQEEGA